MMLTVVGGESIIPKSTGIETGTYDEIQNNLGMSSPVSGCTPESTTAYACLNALIYDELK